MKASSPLFRPCRLAARILGLTVLTVTAALAQSPQARILVPIVDTARTMIPGSRSPRAVPSADAGAVPATTELHGMTLVFGRSAAQQAALDSLLAAQQNPASPLYHQWLTPDQFAAQFGMADSDLAKAQNWLQSQGFAIEAVSRGKDRIQFSGTAAQVASAFQSPLHYYKVNGETHFAPSVDLSIPSALASTVLGISNLSDFRPQPQVRFRTIPAPSAVTPAFTSSQTGNHFLTPKDIATIYDVNAAYSAGYNGTGQSIAVVGQSGVVTSDVTRFQTLIGVTVKAPTLVLVPNTGSSAIVSGDEAESDLDLEYTSGMAPGANIFFVYTGSGGNAGAFDALTYAIQERVAPIISVSYASCELLLGATNYATLSTPLAQAAAQGQTVIAAAGDEGSTSCSGVTGATAAQQQTVSASFPASSQYVTGMGGTEFPAADVAAANTTYWAASTGTDVVSSALSYIPEQVWNDDTTTATELSAGGGGISTFTPRPSWQTGVPGIPAGNYRLIPDISLTSSPANAPYLFCSSDTSGTGITGSCSNGFRDVNNQNLTGAGGTSFAAPVFAGMFALISQARNSNGQGLINPTLYTLAANASTYATAFHDITSGSNACLGSAALCTAAAAAVYPAGTGYDEASGLGSIDLYHLLGLWPTTSASALASSTTTVTAASTTPLASASDIITITVAPATSSSIAPTGTVSLTVDGSVVNASLALSNGTATYTFSSATAGSHVIVASYSGDANYAASSGTTAITVGGATGTFSIAAPALSVKNGSSGSSTITVTPANGYTGTLAWSLSSTATINNVCFSINNLAVTGTTPATTTLTIYAGGSQCASAIFNKGTGVSAGRFGSASAANHTPASPFRVPAAFGFAGLLMFGLVGRRSRQLRGQMCGLVAVAVLALAGIGLVGCSDNSFNGTATTLATTGSFQVTLTGTDTNNANNTASSTFTLTIQ